MELRMSCACQALHWLAHLRMVVWDDWDLWCLPSEGSPSTGHIKEKTDKYNTVSSNAVIPVIGKNYWEHRGQEQFPLGEGSGQAPEKSYFVLSPKELVVVCQAEEMGIGRIF